MEKKNILENWKARVGKNEANKISKDAAVRGTATHLLIERFLKGEDLKLNEFKQKHIKLFNSLKLELNHINNIYGQEVVLFSDVLNVAGRCDLIAEYKGELSIVDYKTSTRIKDENDIEDYWLQCAFYALAHNEMFNTDIKKLVILMGIENKLPRIFKKELTEELILKLAERICKFFDRI